MLPRVETSQNANGVDADLVAQETIADAEFMHDIRVKPSEPLSTSWKIQERFRAMDQAIQRHVRQIEIIARQEVVKSIEVRLGRNGPNQLHAADAFLASFFFRSAQATSSE